MRKAALAIIFTIITFQGYSQFMVGLKFMGLAIHPKKTPIPHIYKGSIDNKGHVVITRGLIFTGEIMLYREAISLSAAQIFIFSDCAGQFTGMSHLGLKFYQYFSGGRHITSIAGGPMLFYRQTWENFDGYKNRGLFKTSANGKWQTKFVWHGGELEYNYRPENSPASLSVNILPGIPEVIAIAPGLKYYSEPSLPTPRGIFNDK